MLGTSYLDHTNNNDLLSSPQVESDNKTNPQLDKVFQTRTSLFYIGLLMSVR